ncbi:hypothetical protein fHeYen301_16 [Yersinia phage fHe-Yen3-01]|uniref:Uncharacterized protein n=1 Tax=Yersinia phage fHe-Yen3-01 TaxID=1932893 RepID=A0A1L7DQF1_9CAUD|nr:hypothetical protein HOR56_gp16 [Yersinia phage fHe-Yen3-01]APU00349.1 hypothetical protein fHeYen301_16 [Yersinia phage fHe-Yen3-01]
MVNLHIIFRRRLTDFLFNPKRPNVVTFKNVYITHRTGGLEVKHNDGKVYIYSWHTLNRVRTEHC